MPNGNEDKTKQLLNDQLTQRDPFQKAREKQELGEITPTAMAFDPFENPLSPFEERPVLEPKLPEAPKQKLEDSLAPADPQKARSFMRSRVASQLDALGLGDIKEGVSLTTMGKILLMSRLKNRVGEGFEANPAVRQILNLFDSALDKVDEKDEEAEMVRAKSTADRTIKELLGNEGRRKARI